MNRVISKYILKIILCLIILFQSTNSFAVDYYEAPKSTDFKVISTYKCYDNQGQYGVFKGVCGTVKNVTSEKRAIHIKFYLYDKDGNLVGEAFNHNNSIKSGETWNFQTISYPNRDFFSYSDAKIESFY